MATKKKGSSIAGLQKQKASLRAKISAANKKKSDAKKAEKLRREITSLKGQLNRKGAGTTGKRKRSR